MFKVFGVGDDEDNQVAGTDMREEDFDNQEVGQIALDILENDEHMTIIAPIAGVEMSEIDLYLNKNVLTLRGKREKPIIYESDVKVRNSECFWGKFVRNIILPENLNFKKIRAVMENNLLMVSIPKQLLSAKNIKIDRVDMD